MGVTELRTFQIRCDRCHRIYGNVTTADYPTLPAGWGRAQTHGCGSTGYTRTDVICDACREKAERNV